MNTDTGEIKPIEQWLREMGEERFNRAMKNGRLIPISKMANPDCIICHGKGFSKQWWQKKVKPCRCVK